MKHGWKTSPDGCHSKCNAMHCHSKCNRRQAIAVNLCTLPQPPAACCIHFQEIIGNRCQRQRRVLRKRGGVCSPSEFQGCSTEWHLTHGRRSAMGQSQCCSHNNLLNNNKKNVLITHGWERKSCARGELWWSIFLKLHLSQCFCKHDS